MSKPSFRPRWPVIWSRFIAVFWRLRDVSQRFESCKSFAKHTFISRYILFIFIIFSNFKFDLYNACSKTDITISERIVENNRETKHTTNQFTESQMSPRLAFKMRFQHTTVKYFLIKSFHLFSKRCYVIISTYLKETF